jgi:adenosine deaminase
MSVLHATRLALACLALLLSACAAHQHAPQDGADRRFEAAKASPPQLRAFLYRMPKGGDLHSHLSGAAYTETLIDAGAASGVCIDPAKTAVAPCGSATRKLADALRDSDFRRALIDAWSMRGFVPSSGVSGHDHFFAAFAKFAGAANMGDMAADVVNRAGRQHMRYLELMVTYQGRAVTGMARRLRWTGDMAEFHRQLIAAGLPMLLAHARSDMDAGEARMRSVLHCDTPQAEPGCNVTVRWVEQVIRSNPPGEVFAQMLFGALLSQADPRVVGLNFVAPALRFHVRQAVELGHAKRIGHGVDVMYEIDPLGLLREMADKRIAVEINLTSNDQILSVAGDRHPFPVYRAVGVPTLLSTDDEGVERIDRTHELERAATEFDLDWPTLVALERNTLEYAFVAGASLWADPMAWRKVPACDGTGAPPPAQCAAFLRASEKARLQWEFERDLDRFERESAWEQR